VPDLTARKLKRIYAINMRDAGQACGLLYDAVAQGRLRHLGTPELAAALDGAVKRPLGDAWAWSRKSSSVDISPLVAATLALWGLENAKPVVPRVWGPMLLDERLRQQHRGLAS
jgi:hypothetical protein